jgi:quercetin dioxygenase-like cupin family protein
MKNLKLAMVAITIALLAGTWGMQRSSAQPAGKAAPPAAGAPAAPAGFKRTELQKHDLSVAGREAITARGEFQPGAAVPRHTHPGEEVGYVVEGELTVEIDGQPPKAVKAGEAFFIPAGTVHAGKNTGKGTTTVLSTYVTEKGKPLATPAK